MTGATPTKKPKLTAHEQAMHALYRSLPKELPEHLTAGEVVAEMEGEPDYAVRVLRSPPGQPEVFAMVADRATAAGDVRQVLTPPLSRETIVDVAGAVMVGWQRIVTWPHAVKVLAMGVALGLAQRPVNTPKVDDPEPSAPAAAAEVAVA